MKNKPTQKEWGEIFNKLVNQSAISLKCDKDKITIKREVDKNKLAIKYAVYVNGWIKGEWLIEKHRESKYFQEQIYQGEVISYKFAYLSFNVLKNRFMKNCKKISLIL